MGGGGVVTQQSRQTDQFSASQEMTGEKKGDANPAGPALHGTAGVQAELGRIARALRGTTRSCVALRALRGTPPPRALGLVHD